MKITFWGLESEQEKIAAEKLSGREIIFRSGVLDESFAETDASEIISVFVDSAITSAVLEHFPKLKLIAARSTGYDHIDLSACRARGVAIATVPSYGENTVAEFAFALILALSRKIPEAHEQVRETGSFSQKNLRGFDLAGRTLGVVGTGRIGIHSVRIGLGFGMKVVAADPFPKPELARELSFVYLPLDELLSQSDIITLHAPLNSSTHHLINRNNINRIKPGACLINTARGGLVETAALVEALEKNILAAAGLDVLEEEGMMVDELKLFNAPHPALDSLKTTLANHYLINHPRVIITPHNAFNTTEALNRILATTLDNINSFIVGQPANLVE